MRVALLGPFYPYRGGIAHYAASLFRALEKAGHSVLAFNFTRQYPSFLFPGQTQADQSNAPIDVANKRCVDSLNPLTWVSTGIRIAKSKPDLLVVQWWHPYFAPSYGTIARVVRRFSKTKVVFLCHNVVPHESSVVDRALLHMAYRSADAFVVGADLEKKRLAGFLKKKPPIQVAPHPTYHVFAEGQTPLNAQQARQSIGIDAEKLVLFFGYIRPYKGLSVLLEAMGLLEHPDIKLVIAGESYEDPTVYHRQIEKLGLNDRVTFHNRYIPNERVPDYFSAADVVALPYRSATQSGIVQMAYAFGVPVIVSAVGGIPEVVADGKTGLLVPKEDPQAMATAIGRFFDENLGSDMERAIEIEREAFSWQRVVEAIEQTQ